MKVKKLAVLFLLSVFSFSIAACNDNNENPPKEDPENNTDYSIISGAFDFDKEKNIYLSTKYSSSLVFNKEFMDGTISSNMKVDDSFSDNGIILSKDKTTKDYYFFGINIANKLVFNYVNGETTKNLFNEKVVAGENKHNISLFKDLKNNDIEFYLDNVYVFSLDMTNLEDYKYYGLLANGKGTEFSGINTTENESVYDNTYDNYLTRYGEFINTDSVITSNKTNSITSSIGKEFSNGSISMNVSLSGYASDSGFIFNLNDNGAEKFWETGTSYYFLFLSKDSYIYLGKVNNGTWNALSYTKVKNFDFSGTYNLKLIKNNEKMFCYCDDVLYLAYEDATPLTGTSVGLRAGVKDVSYTDIRISEKTYEDQEIDTSKYNVISGGFDEVEGNLFSTKKDSIILDKTNKMKNGTIETSIIPGNSSENGIIFRASYNDENVLTSYYYFYLTNGMMITFYKYDKGITTKVSNKYLPYGSSTSKAYSMKIVMNNSKIYCYFDGRCSEFYDDDNPLTGEYYGVKAGDKNCLVSKFKYSADTKNETNEVLMFGHSYMEYWYTYKDDFDEYEDINDIGIGGSIGTHWSETYLNEVATYESKLGIYWIGINDLSQGITPLAIYNSTKKLLTGIKAINSNFEVVLLGVNRCTARGLYSEITATNNYFKSLDTDYDYIKYVDTELLFCNTSGTPQGRYFVDGLHPTHEAYLMTVDEVRKVLN